MAKRISKVAKPHLRKSGKAGAIAADVLDAVGLGRGRDRKPRKQNPALNERRRKVMKRAKEIQDKEGFFWRNALKMAWKQVK